MSPLLRSLVFLLGLVTASCQAVIVSKDVLNIDVNVFDFELIMDTTSNGLLLDVRTDNEFAQGHLRGAQQIDFFKNDFSNALKNSIRINPFLSIAEAVIVQVRQLNK